MFRGMIVALFLLVGVQGFSEEKTPFAWDSESVYYLGQGNLRLLWNEPWSALENFERASLSIQSLDPMEDTLEFLVWYGRIIAYDILGLEDECRRAIGSLFLTIYSGYRDFEEEDDDDEDCAPFASCGKGLEILRKLAAKAPSEDVRGLLLDLLDDVEEGLASD